MEQLRHEGGDEVGRGPIQKDGNKAGAKTSLFHGGSVLCQTLNRGLNPGNISVT